MTTCAWWSKLTAGLYQRGAWSAEKFGPFWYLFRGRRFVKQFDLFRDLKLWVAGRIENHKSTVA